MKPTPPLPVPAFLNADLNATPVSSLVQSRRPSSPQLVRRDSWLEQDPAYNDRYGSLGRRETMAKRRARWEQAQQQQIQQQVPQQQMPGSLSRSR